MTKETYVPMKVRQQRADVKRLIKSFERDRKEIWRRFKRSVEGEFIGSPFYDAQFGNAKLRDMDIQQQIVRLKEELPPYLIWNVKLGCLERIAVRR